MSLRQRVAELLEANRPDDHWGRSLDIFLIALILANVLAVFLEGLPELEQWHDTIFLPFEVFSVLVFTIEYVLRLWSCVDRQAAAGTGPLKTRIKWMVSPLGLVDLLAIAPFYLFLFLPASSQSLLILRIFRGVRLLRIFKLTRYSPALHVLKSVLLKEARTLAVVAFILLVILIVASYGIYILEKDVQPEAFGHVALALWWAVVSLTTVGYGDIVPISAMGRFFAGIVALVGIAMMALPAGIMASGFSTVMRRREKEYGRAVSLALAENQVSEDEADELDFAPRTGPDGRGGPRHHAGRQAGSRQAPPLPALWETAGAVV